MSTDDNQNQNQIDEPGETAAGDLTDELAKKYDPDRLLRIVSRRAGRGDPLEHSVRSRYEKRFGVDLGHVRVYSGELAEELNRRRGAYALTVGATGMILMGNSPDKSIGSASGQALLAHELTHVAQQSKGLHRKATFDGGMPFAEEHEVEADAVEHAVHAEEMGAAGAAADSHDGAKAVAQRMDFETARKEQIEQIKQRVMDLVGEAARSQHLRNGSTRRA